MIFTIDGKPHDIDVETSSVFFGEQETLSTPKTDISYTQDWYDKGFNVSGFLTDAEFTSLLKGVSSCVCNIIQELGIDTPNFCLEKYHHYVRDDETHLKMAKTTRDLFSKDFNFSIPEIVTKLEQLLNLKLTDVNPDTNLPLHIIVRINRPNSSDFNPIHKDIYQEFDETDKIPKCINFWIPICGVTPESMLPVAPGSHLISEDKILRTFNGGIVNGKKYRVRSVLQWNGKSELHRPEILDGQVLMFSSHLIHGCAINNQDDTTRVALEFRLFHG